MSRAAHLRKGELAFEDGVRRLLEFECAFVRRTGVAQEPIEVVEVLWKYVEGMVELDLGPKGRNFVEVHLVALEKG